jgi:hypothetical protein
MSPVVVRSRAGDELTSRLIPALSSRRTERREIDILAHRREEKSTPAGSDLYNRLIILD